MSKIHLPPHQRNVSTVIKHKCENNVDIIFAPLSIFRVFQLFPKVKFILFVLLVASGDVNTLIRLSR